MNPLIASFLSEVEPGFLSLAVITTKISEEETIPTENLPEELIADILSRLPVKSLLKFRCVYKTLSALVTNPAFAKEHLNRSLASNSNRNLIFSRHYLSSVDLDACEQEEVVELDCLLKNPRMTTKVLGSFNGLLCISHFDDDILLWNPSIRRHHAVPITPVVFAVISYTYFMVFGFGYDPTTDDYKVVRVVQSNIDYSCDSEVKVYSLSTNSWRRIRGMPCVHIFGYRVLANYALHWVAMRKTGPGKTSRFIVSFDLREEEYREVLLPDYVGHQFRMTLGVLGGRLSLLCIFAEVGVEVWLMKDYGVRDSWVTQFSLKPSAVIWPFDKIRPICYSKNGEVILDKKTGKMQLILSDPRSGRVRNIRLCDARGRNGNEILPKYKWNLTEISVGSLVPPSTKDGTQQTSMRKRKRHIFGIVAL